jgi:hypothetical protein
MKVITLKKAVLLTIAVVGLGMAPTAQAAHAAEYLDPLQTEIATRLENLPDDTEADVRRALTKANASLNRNSRTLSADLGLLSQAGTALSTALAEDGTLNGLQNDALNNYAGEAQAQLNAVWDKVGTNDPPVQLANQLEQAQAALDRGLEGTNSVSVRAKAIAFALNKARVANILATRTFKAPVSLSDRNLTLTSRGGPTIVVNANGTYYVGDSEAPEETGTASYGRTTANTGILELSGGHTLFLRFANARGGTWSQETEEGTVRGKFTVEQLPLE